MYEDLVRENSSIILEVVNEKKLHEWVGPKGYIYRLKIMILLHSIEKYKCPLLLVDCDTIFITSPKDLLKRINDPNFVVLHYIENKLQNKTTLVEKNSQKPLEKKFFKEVVDNGYLDDGTKRYRMNPDMDQWNSGVIGLHHNNAYLLERALILTDYIFKKSEIRVAEQFALSCVFQQEKEVYSADGIVFHYWFFKECRYMLENYYDQSKYDYPSKYMKENVVAQIKLIKNWNVSFDELFLMIVCVMRKNRKKA